MEGHDRLCMNCFAGHNYEKDGAACPVCGWDNTKAQVPEGLKYGTVLASRYLIGRAKSMNGEGITYSALDRLTKKVVEIREFYPMSLSERNSEDQTISPISGKEALFEDYLDDFVELSKGISRLRELTVMDSILEIFEENYTAYAVYEYVPSVTLRRYLENSRKVLTWNEVNGLFMPVLTALGLMNSLGITHLGISPDTLRVNKDGVLFLTGFSINASRQTGTPLIEELYPGCAALEQYAPKATCGEVSDVYAFAATMVFALTGSVPEEATKRLKDQRLLISREVLKNLPPFVVTALANALQVKQEARTTSFERLKAELSAAPTIVSEVDQTDAIRRLPSMELDIPQNRGLPPIVWLIGSFVVTLIALLIVASIWLNDKGMSFTDIQGIFAGESSSAAVETVPNMINEKYDDWVKKIEDGEYHFKLKVSSREFSETVEEGNIISQSPFSGETLSQDDTVVVTVSKGSPTRTLPEIKGMTFAELMDILKKNGFSPVKEEQPSDDIDAGYVIGYKDHKEGDSLDYGETVTVFVSSGPEES